MWPLCEHMNTIHVSKNLPLCGPLQLRNWFDFFHKSKTTIFVHNFNNQKTNVRDLVPCGGRAQQITLLHFEVPTISYGKKSN
jgi:hypothetical protein